jgi:hypothetical protein
MASVLNYLEKMTKRERIVKRSIREMNGGEPWVFPIELKKGAGYSLSACARPGARLGCTLYKGRDETPLAEREGTSGVSLSMTPEVDGLYRFVVAPQPSDSRPRKVTVTVRKLYIPSRVRAWSYPPLE